MSGSNSSTGQAKTPLTVAVTSGKGGVGKSQLIASLAVVPVPGHDWHPAEAIAPQARFFPDIVNALAAIPEDGLPVLIAGSLYLAGDVLRRNGEAPE